MNSILWKIGKSQLHKTMHLKMSKYGIILQLTLVFLCQPFVYAQEELVPVVTERAATSEVEGTAENAYEEKLKRWQSLSEEERQKIRERARKLSSEQIKELKEKVVKFRNLPPEEQDKIKANYQRFKELPLEKKRILKERVERFQKLPPEEKAKLQRKFREKKEIPPTRPDLRKDIPDWKEDIRDRREEMRERKDEIKDKREIIKERGLIPDKGRKPPPKLAPRKELRAPKKAPLPIRKK